MFSSIPGLYPGDASSSPHLNCDNQDRLCQMSPGDAKSPWVENHCLKPQPDSMPTSPDASHFFQMPTAHPHLLSTLAQMIPKHSRCCPHSLCRHHNLSDVSHSVMTTRVALCSLSPQFPSHGQHPCASRHHHSTQRSLTFVTCRAPRHAHSCATMPI